MDELTPNQIHAVLHILTFYDPYTTVHDVTADPDDPNAEGAELTRALDDFGVYPGTCLYCKGQKSGQPRDHISNEDRRIGLFRRMILLHLAHHAKVQADALSPCDLRDFTEEELIALGFIEYRSSFSSPSLRPEYQMIKPNFAVSVRLTDDLMKFEKDFPRSSSRHAPRTAKVLIRPGEVLSPFTHAMRAAGGPPSERGLEPCLEAVKRIVDWDVKRYSHFGGFGEELFPYFDVVFPYAIDVVFPSADVVIQPFRRWFHSRWAPFDLYPAWAWFLVDRSGGYDKGLRLMNQFRALNLPAIRENWGVEFDKTAAEASSERRGCCGVLLSPWDLYLHRNIGFSVKDYQEGVDALIRHYPLPERCGLERISPETIHEDRIKNEYSSEFGTSFHDFDLRDKRIRKSILVYVCD